MPCLCTRLKGRAFETRACSDDRRGDLNEFKAAIPKLAEWDVVVNDPVAEFAVVDANGGGFVLFDEFAGWALQKGLDMLDDGDEDSEAGATPINPDDL